MLEGALRQHSDRTAPGGVCIWSVRPFVRPFLLRRGGCRGAGRRVDGGVASSASEWDDLLWCG
jgi:hypothetical protein